MDYGMGHVTAYEVEGRGKPIRGGEEIFIRYFSARPYHQGTCAFSYHQGGASTYWCHRETGSKFVTDIDFHWARQVVARLNHTPSNSEANESYFEEILYVPFANARVLNPANEHSSSHGHRKTEIFVKGLFLRKYSNYTKLQVRTGRNILYITFMWKCNSKCEFIILHIYNVQTKKLRYPKYQKHRATEQRSGINGMMLLRDQTNFRDTYKLGSTILDGRSRSRT